MAIKTTRLKTAQVPRMITVDLTDQMDGIKQTFDLPMKVYSQMTHYLLFNGTVYRNSKRNTYYSIDKSGKVLTTYFTYPPEPSPSHSLQFVVSDNAEGSDMGTEVYIDDNKAIDLQISTNNGRIVEANGYSVGQYDDNEKARVEALVQNEATARADADTEIENELDAKQDKLTQGDNITIDGNTISAAGSANIVKLTLTAHKLYLDGVEQHYTDIERLVETEGNYVVVYGDDDVVMKVSAVTSDAVEFATSYISGGEAFVQRVIINAEDEIKEDCLNVSDSGSASVLYDGLGAATDGAMTQNAVTETLYPMYNHVGQPGTEYDYITLGNPNVNKTYGGGWSKVIAIGNSDTKVSNQFGVAIGKAESTGSRGIAISSPSNSSLTTASGESSVAIGTIAKAKDNSSVAIGNSSSADTAFSVALGRNANAKATGLVAGSSVGGVAVGNYAKAGSFGVSVGVSAGYQGAENNLSCSVALGAYSMPRAAGTVDVSTTGDSRHLGYNGTDYRLITGVHDPVEAQDAATKAYVDAAIAALRTELGL